MNTYRLIHRVTGQREIVRAESAQDAAEIVGWMVGDCFIRNLSERSARDNALPLEEPRLRGAERMYRRG